MGLDISFSKEAADACEGIEFKTERNGDDNDIAAAIAEGDECQPGYVEWLQSEQRWFRVPGMAHWVGIDEGAVKYPESDDWIPTYQVRANKWGATYSPLTKWLKYNNIDWSEF